MTPRRISLAKPLDPDGVSVHLSDEARTAFRDLGALVHFSEHFDSTVASIVDDIAAGRDLGLSGLLMSLPLIAVETSRYIAATDDQRAKRSWQDIEEAFAEHRYTLTQGRMRGRAR